MNEKVSQFHSMKISLGTPGSSRELQKEQLRPWVMLICSDLGFISGTPQQISSSTFGELLEKNDIHIKGVVDSGLPQGFSPFYIDYQITDFKDFSHDRLCAKIPLLKMLADVSAILDMIIRKKMAPSEGLQQIAAIKLPPAMARQIAAIIPPFTADTNTDIRQSSQMSNVDKILSMVELGSSQNTEDRSEPRTPPRQPADLVAALAQGTTPDFSVAALNSCKDSIDNIAAQLGRAVAEQSFFTTIASSWNALKTLLKTAGRSRDLHIYLHSAPLEAAIHHFSSALTECAVSSGIPDLVVWDYPVTTDNAAIQHLKKIGTVADRYNSSVVTSLHAMDDLYKSITGGEPLQAVFGQPALIALRRLQAENASRCLSLCAPEAVAPRSGDNIDLVFTGAWLYALQWTVSLIENCSPFHLQNSSLLALDGFAFPKISTETVLDAYQCGITVLRPGGTTSPRVLMENADSPFGSLLFNMMVNRAARLAAEWIGKEKKTLSCNQAAPLIAAYLTGQLQPYAIVSSDDSISATVENTTSLKIKVVSDMTVAGFPVKFDFSFEYEK